MAQSNHYDIIIIGSGAGGGTLAWKLAPSGKRVLLLERGDYVPREKDNWSTRAVNLEGKYNTKELCRDKDAKPLHPHTNYYVGGNTKFYGAALFRLREKDFGELRHHGGFLPPGRFPTTSLSLLHASGRALSGARRARRRPH
jgi:choline dehydrogenase-like flavoprotein